MSAAIDAIRLASTARLQGSASTAVFRVLLEALARPGRPLELPELAMDPRLPNALLLPLALADLGTSFWVHGLYDERERKLAADVVREATGARLAAPNVATFVVCLDGDPSVPSRVRIGSELAPEAGVKMAVQVENFATGAPISITGPGIAEAFITTVGLDRAFLKALRNRNQPPVGIDTWVFDRHHRVLALPRSTRIGVVDDAAREGVN